LEGLAKLLAHQRAAGETEGALQTGLTLLGLDPLQEPVHRALMRLYAEAGRRGAALRQHQQCVGVLQRELGVEPEAETKQVYQELLREQPGRAARGDRLAPAPPVPVQEGPAPETPLIGREAELSWLYQAREAAWGGRGRLVLVRGEAGIGKSRLVAAVVEEAREHGARVLVGHAFETQQIVPVEGDLRGAAAALRGALQTFSAVEARYETARTRLELAERTAALGDPRVARDQLREAHRSFLLLRIPCWVAQAEAIGAELAITLDGEGP
jgi:hypothetical protein